MSGWAGVGMVVVVVEDEDQGIWQMDVKDCYII